MRHLSTEMGKPCRSSVFCLFLLVSLVNAHDNNNVTTTETLSNWTTDSNSVISTGSMSESTTMAGSTIDTTSATTSVAGSTIDTTSATTSVAGSAIDATSVTTSMAGSQAEFTTLTKTTVMTTMQSGNPSTKNNKIFRAALIINPLQKNTKRAGPGRKLKKKASHLLYQEFGADGKLITEFPMKNLDDVATFFNVYYNTEICREVCEERD